MATACLPENIMRLRFLYHLTWDCNVPSILSNGLIPNGKPNRWMIAAANERSKGKTYLCSQRRREYWEMTYGDGWIERPSPNSKLVWLKVDCQNIKLTADSGRD